MTNYTPEISVEVNNNQCLDRQVSLYQLHCSQVNDKAQQFQILTKFTKIVL